MPHFYVNPKDIKDKNFTIENEQFHYLSNVRRFSVGDEINIFDGLGNSYKARIDNIYDMNLFENNNMHYNSYCHDQKYSRLYPPTVYEDEYC